MSYGIPFKKQQNYGNYAMFNSNTGASSDSYAIPQLWGETPRYQPLNFSQSNAIGQDFTIPSAQNSLVDFGWVMDYGNNPQAQAQLRHDIGQMSMPESIGANPSTWSSFKEFFSDPKTIGNGLISLGQLGIGAYGTLEGIKNQRTELGIHKDKHQLNRDMFNEQLRHRDALRRQNAGTSV